MQKGLFCLCVSFLSVFSFHFEIIIKLIGKYREIPYNFYFDASVFNFVLRCLSTFPPTYPSTLSFLRATESRLPEPSWPWKRRSRTDEQCLPVHSPGALEGTCLMGYSGAVPHGIMTMGSVPIEAGMCRELDCLPLCNSSSDRGDLAAQVTYEMQRRCAGLA